MARIPTPRSYNSILGDLISSFLSRTGLKSLKVGSPVLSILESAAQSDLRSSQDVFDLLNASSLDTANGTALDRIAADEDLQRLGESAATGLVTVTDTSFVKIESRLFQGLAAPIVGSSTINVVDASAFPATGSVYIGRGTTNFEGPLAYTGKVSNGPYWTLTLSGVTRRFHNVSESVVLAQGGDRVIDSGSTVQTPQGNVVDAVRFSTLFSATLPDGEVTLTSIQVVAEIPGVAGNVPALSVASFVSPPFVGAVVSNPLPFTNGRSAEDDLTLRERIRAVRRSRSKGTSLAITSSVQGIVAQDENKRLSSASLVNRQGEESTLYIDDGTGYEESSAGVAIERLVDKAFGGEQYFQVASPRPVAKAAVTTVGRAPFTLSSGSTLSVKVAGAVSAHTFTADQFGSIGNASAYEVAASINADPELAYSAATSEGGTRVRVFAKASTNEDIEVVASEGLDANANLLFPVGTASTLLLYKNDVLLSKDGSTARIFSRPVSSWGNPTSGSTLLLSVDKTATATYTFVDQDFIDAQTGFSSVGQNTAAAWAKVLNFKVPGITAEEAAGLIQVTSNSGNTARAGINVVGGTLVTSGLLFDVQSVSGKDNDYTLDRNTGNIKLEKVLAAGDNLSLGTLATRAFIEGSYPTPVTLTLPAELWFVVDGNPSIVPTGLLTSSSVTFATYAPVANTVRVTGPANAFANVQAGDWAIFQDDSFTANNKGAWRVALVDPAFTFVEIEKTAFTAETKTLAAGGIVFVRTPYQVKKVTLSAAIYTASSLASAIVLEGAKAVTYKTSRLRIRTNSFGPTGNVALVASNIEGLKLQLPVLTAKNSLNQLPSIVSGNSEVGSPLFVSVRTTAATGNAITIDNVTNLNTQRFNPSHQIQFVRTAPADEGGVARSRWGTNTGLNTGISDITGSVLTLNKAAPQEYIALDRSFAGTPLALSGVDDLVVLVDNDIGKRYAINMYRNVKSTNNTYGATVTLSDADNGNATLASAFGQAFNFTDFAVYMRSRVRTHAESGATNKTILYRSKVFGTDGSRQSLVYAYPSAPSQPVTVSSNSVATTPVINISLPSGPARTGFTLRNTGRMRISAVADGAIRSINYAFGLSVTSAVKNLRINYTGRGTAQFTGTVTNGAGATGTVVSDSLAAGATGAGILTLAPASGTFSPGETITGTTGSATVGSAGYYTTATTDIATPGVASNGFVAADTFYVASNNVNFVSGVKTVDSATGTTVTYLDEGLATVAATPNIGNVSYDVGEATLSGSNIVVNDIFNVGTLTGLVAGDITAPYRITAIGPQYVKVRTPTTATAPGSLTQILNVSSLSFYPINVAVSKASDIASAVNAFGPISPITANPLGLSGDASGVISQASFDEFSLNTKSYPLLDGINWVKLQTSPSLPTDQYTFTFKTAPNAALTGTVSDWQNEEIRLVPVTTQNLVDFLNNTSVTGLSSVAEIASVDQPPRLQISSRTVGSQGSVEVQGGSANSVSASVQGSAATQGSAICTFRTADVKGLTAGMWVELVNSLSAPRQTLIGGTIVDSIDTLGNVVLNSGGGRAWISRATALGASWQIEKQGPYVCFRPTGIPATPSISAVQEGDYVYVVAAGAVPVSQANTGAYRVIRIHLASNSFWIENPNVIEEIATSNLTFIENNSLMPGDKVLVNTDILGVGNQGEWTVESIDLSNEYKFKVSVAQRPTMALVTPVTLPLGSEPAVQVMEGAPSKLVKQLAHFAFDNSDPTLITARFISSQGASAVSESFGTVMRGMNKLEFPTSSQSGRDGYRYNTGLIQEANRVVYGVSSDPATYPGVIAAGSSISISGPLIKRIACGLSLRVKSGISSVDVANRVRSAVASVINATAIGQSIAISDLVAAASRINGVVAVSVTSPAYTSDSDLIPVQTLEKPLVLNLDQDILVSFVGE